MASSARVTNIQSERLIADDLPVERHWGRLTGAASGADGVLLPPGRTEIAWSAAFEVFQPADPELRRGLIVEAENRGRPLCLTLIQEARLVREPPDRPAVGNLGNGFLFRRGLGYARVQWQFGFADVPVDGQGAGLAILRELGRLLNAGEIPGVGPAGNLFLTGYSQGGRLVRTFLREGFNVDPEAGGRVYTGALCLAGGAGYLPVNQTGHEHNLEVNADNAHGGDVPPYTWDALLSRPDSDPLVIEAFTETEYYNRRGSLVTTDVSTLSPNVRHYDLSGLTHILPANDGLARLGLTSEEEFWATTAGGGLAANGGKQISLNYLNAAPYLRALVAALQEWVEGTAQPPPSARHPLRPAAPEELANPLDGVDLLVPETDADGNPIGGVRVPDVAVPLGVFAPVWFDGSRRNTRMIGGFTPFSAAEIARRYPDEAAYLRAYEQAADDLIAERHLLPEDRDALVSSAAAHYSQVVREATR